MGQKNNISWLQFLPNLGEAQFLSFLSFLSTVKVWIFGSSVVSSLQAGSVLINKSGEWT